MRQPIADADPLQHRARPALTGFLKTLAREVAADGVTVNSLLPGFARHRTDPRRCTAATRDPAATGSRPGVIGDPEDFGRIAAFLCSEPATFITGTAIHVDGGAYRGLQ